MATSSMPASRYLSIAGMNSFNCSIQLQAAEAQVEDDNDRFAGVLVAGDNCSLTILSLPKGSLVGRVVHGAKFVQVRPRADVASRLIGFRQCWFVAQFDRQRLQSRSMGVDKSLTHAASLKSSNSSRAAFAPPVCHRIKADTDRGRTVPGLSLISVSTSFSASSSLSALVSHSIFKSLSQLPAFIEQLNRFVPVTRARCLRSFDCRDGFVQLVPLRFEFLFAFAPLLFGSSLSALASPAFSALRSWTRQASEHHQASRHLVVPLSTGILSHKRVGDGGAPSSGRSSDLERA